MAIKLLLCFGTRPEYIKVKSLKDNIKDIPLKTLFTGQHTNLLQDVAVDYTINIDTNNGNRLNDIWCSIMKHNYIFDDITHVIVQGDTSSAVAMALSAFHNGKKIIHLEAGLRTGNIHDPYPEELNRQLISRMATIHLCPTILNKQNLLNENVSGDIYVVGNTGLDNISKSNTYYGNTVLVTLHRRDNIDTIDKWFTSLSQIAKQYSDLKFIFPLHPNPDIRKYRYLLENIDVIEPVDHNSMVTLLKGCKFVISDSGGLQEEASYLGKKIIVCRNSTERPEILGITSVLCDLPDKLVNYVEQFNVDYMVNAICPYKPDDIPVYKKIIDILDNYNNK